MVTDVIRKYETVRITPRPPAENKLKPYNPLDGMELLIKARLGSPPEILTLTPERPMHLDDYGYAGLQIWLPNLIYLLPNTNLSAAPKKVGETWPVVRMAASTLVGLPVQTGMLKAKLEDVAPNAKGDEWTAIISVTGQPTEGQNEIAVNARIVFTFAPPMAPRPIDGVAGDSRPENVVDAHGAITEIRMASVNTQPIDEDNRLRRRSVREFILQRQIHFDGPPLIVPTPLPKANEENSWLTYVDPAGGFEFRLSQDLVFDPEQSDQNRLYFKRQQGDGMKRFVLYAMGDKQKFQPEKLNKELLSTMEKGGLEINRGEEGWLPESDWPGMKVYHMEAAATDVNGVRTQLNGYWVHMGQSPWFFIDAATTLDPPGPFRKEVETIIKGIKLTPKR
jgi:hypothetical protein